ncbi:MAG: SCO family protein [Pseudomonadota bacterium]
MTRIYLIAALLAVVAGSGLSYLIMSNSAGGDDQFAQCRATSVAGGAGEIGGPFTLVSETGETVTDADVITRPSLIYFGYTFCPDVCPLDTARNADAIDLLTDKGLDVQPIFISVDPERDTPDVVADFTANLHEDMLGLTGSPEQVEAASQAYKTYYRKHESDDEFYLVDHSTFSYLVLPEHGFVEFFRRELTPEQLAESTACFVNAA